MDFPLYFQILHGRVQGVFFKLGSLYIMLLQQFSNINAYIRVVGKMPKQHFNALFFSNPGDKVLILVERKRHICPIVLTFFLNLFSWIVE